MHAGAHLRQGRRVLVRHKVRPEQDLRRQEALVACCAHKSGARARVDARIGTRMLVWLLVVPCKLLRRAAACSGSTTLAGMQVQACAAKRASQKVLLPGLLYARSVCASRCWMDVKMEEGAAKTLRREMHLDNICSSIAERLLHPPRHIQRQLRRHGLLSVPAR